MKRDLQKRPVYKLSKYIARTLQMSQKTPTMGQLVLLKIGFNYIYMETKIKRDIYIYVEKDV